MTDDLSLTEPFEAVGEWFLPDAPDRKIRGTLAYKDRWNHLSLEEAFKPLPTVGMVSISIAEPVITYPIIHGVTRTGRKLTLVNAHQTATPLLQEQVMSSLVVVDAHVSDKTLYKELRCRIPGLAIWFGRPIMELKPCDDEARAEFTEYVVSHVPEQIIRVSAIDADLCLAVGVAASFTGGFEATFMGVGLVRLAPDQPQVLDWYWEQLGKLVELLTFLFGAPARPDSLRISPVGEPREAGLLRGTFYMNYCTFSVYHEFYMPCPKIGKPLEEIIERWFDVCKKYEKLSDPCNLAISIFSSKQEWQHLEFLSLMQALEGFHRALLDRHILSRADYKPIKKLLIDAIPPSAPEALKGALHDKLRHGHEISLAGRLDELSERLSADIREIIFGNDGTVPCQWKLTRNYYSHWGQKLKPGILDGQGIVDANVRIRHFLRALYLDLAGVPQEAILAALQGTNSDSQHLLQINARDRRKHAETKQ